MKSNEVGLLGEEDDAVLQTRRKKVIKCQSRYFVHRLEGRRVKFHLDYNYELRILNRAEMCWRRAMISVLYNLIQVFHMCQVFHVFPACRPLTFKEPSLEHGRSLNLWGPFRMDETESVQFGKNRRSSNQS